MVFLVTNHFTFPSVQKTWQKAKIIHICAYLGIKAAGRGIIVSSGIVSLFLFSNPVGAAVGIGGILIGYAMVGGGFLYEMRCNKSQTQRIENVFQKLTSELDMYTEAQNSVFQVKFVSSHSQVLRFLSFYIVLNGYS